MPTTAGHTQRTRGVPGSVPAVRLTVQMTCQAGFKRCHDRGATEPHPIDAWGARAREKALGRDDELASERFPGPREPLHQPTAGVGLGV